MAALLSILLLVSHVVLWAPPSTEPTAPPPETGSPDPGAIGDDRVAAELIPVAVESPEYDAALSSYLSTADQLAQTTAAYRSAERSLTELAVQAERLDRQRGAAALRRSSAERALTRLRSELRELAIATYVHGGPSAEPAEAIDWEDARDRGARRTIFESVTEHHLAEIARQSEILDRAAAEVSRTALLLSSVEGQRESTTFVRDNAHAAAFLLSARLTDEERAVADARLTAWVRGTDFQFIALDAYFKAAARMMQENPSCGVRWEILAAIARVEGRHGTWMGARLDPAGRSSPEIIGIALDGRNNTAVVADSEGGTLDRDSTFDHAVGPLQFLPTSWRVFGADGNGDGDADPHNIYDASLAAARLLCWASTGLETEVGLQRGLYQYNRSEQYVAVVEGWVETYDRIELFP